MPWFVSAYLAAVSITIMYRVLESWGSVTGSVRLSQQNILPSLKSVRNSHRKNDQNVISQSSLSVVSRLAHLEICTERMIKMSLVRTLISVVSRLAQFLCKLLYGAHRTCTTL